MTKTNKEVTRIDKPTKSITRIIKLPNKGDAGYTPVKGKDYFDGVTPSDEKLLSLITPRIPKPIKGDNGKDGKSFTKKEVRDLIEESLGEKMPELMKELEGKGDVTIEELNKGFNIVSKGKKYFVGGDVVGPKLRLLVQMGDLDLPVGLVGQAGKTIKVKTDESGFELGTGGGGGAVDSVNGQTGVVVLDAGDISGFATVATTGSYNDLSDKPTIPTGTIDGTLTTNELVYSIDSNTVGSLAVATYPSLAELAHVKGVTSAIQTQLNAKEPAITTLSLAKGGLGQDASGVADGQIPIGNDAGNSFTLATITAGSNILVTNTAGAITISSTVSGGGSTGRNYYPQDSQASDLTGYKVASTTPSAGVTDNVTIVCPTQNVYVLGEEFATASGEPNTTSLPAGTAVRYLYASITGGTGQIKADLFRYKTTGNEATTGAVTLTYVEGGAAADTITRASGSFITDGFTAGCKITVTGTASNNGTYTVQTVAALTLTLILSDDLVGEVVSSTITTKEKLLRSGESPAFTNTTTQLIQFFYSDSNAYTLATDDRIIFKWWGRKTTGGASRTITIGTEGTASASYIQTTLPVNLGIAQGTSLSLSSLTASEMVITDATKNLVSAPVATYPSLTELTYVKGVTSAIQTQLNGKEPTKGSDDNYVTDAQLVVIGNTSGTNTGDQDLSGLVPYTGATGDVTLGVHGLTLHDIKGDASDGLLIEANNGTDIAILGAGNTANGTWYGSHNIEGTQVAIGKNATTLGKLKLYGNTSGDVTIQPNAVAGTGVVLTAPATTGTIALTSNITGTNSGTNTGDQTITNSSDATSHTVTLSASGGSVQLIEGSNITLTTGGTGSAGTVTIAATAGGTGDVVGPASATDNAIARFDSTTGKLIQNSAATIADTTGDITAGKYNTVAISGASTPTLAVTGTSSISGANTGDQTSVSGNAGTATALQTARTIGTATGDVTSAGSSFDGSTNNTNAYTIANSAVTLAKMADLAQDQFIGRTTASTGVPETATITAAARTVLDDTTVGAMVDTLGGASSTGTGGLVRATSPTLVTPALGTPSSGNLSNCTGIPAPSGIGWSLKSYTTASNATSIDITGLDLATDLRYKIIVEADALGATSSATFTYTINNVGTSNSYIPTGGSNRNDGSATGTATLDFEDSAMNFLADQMNSLQMEMNASLLNYSGSANRVVFQWDAAGLGQDADMRVFHTRGAGYQNTQTNMTSIKFFSSVAKDWRVWILQVKTS